MASPDDTSVRVALRIRPQSASEKIEMCRMCTSVTPDHPQVILGKDKAFTYDHVFDTDSVQDSIYNALSKELIEGCFEGYNATILAYGQTGSGKTYTMGTGFDLNCGPDEIGIIPRAMCHLFDGITKRREQAREEDRPPPEFNVMVQFLELYNEEIIDLLDIQMKHKKIVKIHEDASGSIYTTGVVSKPVHSSEECLKCLEEGALSRTTASTMMNATSSRSHALFTILLKQHRMVQKDAASDGEQNGEVNGTAEEEFETLSAKFNFVDLAGSERLKRTGATGDRAKEGISINQGLLCLGNVISALGDKQKRGCHVPYRDSKLTRLLQDSLGGNSLTVMIACVSPSDKDFMETLNTLKYANRARNIKNKVMVNQDKASRQIALLRAEIQQLTLELFDYKQGKRIVDESGEEHVSDMFYENTMLRTENETMRLRIKAMQQTIDNQTSKITDLKATEALQKIGDGGEGHVEEIIESYIKEIEELRNQLIQSESMSSSAIRRAHNISRMAMAPTSPEAVGASSILELAKLDLRKDKKRIKKISHSHPPSPIKENSPQSPWEDVTHDDEKDIAELEKEETNQEKENEEEANEGDEEGDDVEDDEEFVGSSDSDDEQSLADTSIQEEALREDIVDLSTEITIKQKLIDELETSQRRLTALKHQYEEKMSLLQNKIKATQDERDKVLKSIGSVDVRAEEKAREVRKTYEKKLQGMQKELTRLQSAKREHQRLLRNKEQNEAQLKILKSELGELKKTKVKLMRQMREELGKAKQREDKISRQLESTIKDNRKRDIQIKTLKSEQKQKDLILKRKQEELHAMRKQIKPISGQLGNKRKQETEQQSLYRPQPVSLHTNEDKHEPRRRGPISNKKIAELKYSTPKRSPAVSRNAKKKWEMLERKMHDLMLRMKTVANMENDMERWLQDRDRISRQLESCRRKKEEAVKIGREESIILEINDQFEALTAQMDYIQENITESQNTITDMEDVGEMINATEIMTGCSLSEARYLLEHFYSKSVELGQELANRDAAYKELQLRLEAMEQHSEVQQQLLQHVYIEKNYFVREAGEDDDEGLDTIAENGVDEQLHFRARNAKKGRRRTGTPEEFLKPASALRASIENHNELTLTNIEDIKEKRATFEKSDSFEKVKPTEISQALMQKLLEIEMSRKQKGKDKDIGDSKLMPPPAPPHASNSAFHEGKSRSVSLQLTGSTQSLNESTGSTSSISSLPPSFQRGNRISKSARTFGTKLYKPVSGSGPKSQPSSASNSPTASRKSSDAADRNRSGSGSHGQMLPVKAPAGKPDSLVCTHTATGHNNAVLSLAVTEDLLITGSKDRTAKVWDLNRGDEVLSLSGHKRDVTVVRYSPVSKLVFTVNQSTIKMWDIRQHSGTCVKTLSGSFFQLGETSIMDLGLNANGNILYSALGNTVKMVDLKTYGTLGKLSGHTGAVTCLLVTESIRGKDICVTGSKDHYIKVFEIFEEVVGSQMPRQNLEPPHYDGVQSLALQNHTLFSGSRDNSIKKWNFYNHKLQYHIVSAHKDWVQSLDFIPKYDVLVSGCRGGLLKAWHGETSSPLGEVNAHSRAINAIGSNSTCIFTASSDRLVRIWKPTPTLDDQLSEISQSKS